jgi:hypothetical protein
MAAPEIHKFVGIWVELSQTMVKKRTPLWLRLCAGQTLSQALGRAESVIQRLEWFPVFRNSLVSRLLKWLSCSPDQCLRMTLLLLKAQRAHPHRCRSLVLSPLFGSLFVTRPHVISRHRCSLRYQPLHVVTRQVPRKRSLLRKTVSTMVPALV